MQCLQITSYQIEIRYKLYFVTAALVLKALKYVIGIVLHFFNT